MEPGHDMTLQWCMIGLTVHFGPSLCAGLDRVGVKRHDEDQTHQRRPRAGKEQP